MKNELYKKLQHRGKLEEVTILINDSALIGILDSDSASKFDGVSDFKRKVAFVTAFLDAGIRGVNLLQNSLIELLVAELQEPASEYSDKFPDESDLITSAFRCDKMLFEISEHYINYVTEWLKQVNRNMKLDWVDTSEVFRVAALATFLMVNI